MSFHERHPGYPVRKHGEERVPLAVRVFKVCFLVLNALCGNTGFFTTPRLRDSVIRDQLSPKMEGQMG